MLTREQAALFVAANPGIVVSLGGTVARVVWADLDVTTAEAVAGIERRRFDQLMRRAGEAS